MPQEPEVFNLICTQEELFFLTCAAATLAAIDQENKPAATIAYRIFQSACAEGHIVASRDGASALEKLNKFAHHFASRD